MRSARLELRVEPELLARIDAAAGDVPRSRWVERAIERALSEANVDRQLRELRDTPADREFRKRLGVEDVPPGRQAVVPVFSGKPQRHQFGSGEEWQEAVRAWKAAQ